MWLLHTRGMSALAFFTLLRPEWATARGLGELDAGKVNHSTIDKSLTLCLRVSQSLSLHRCGMDTWRAEGWGPHLRWLISAASMCNPCGQYACWPIPHVCLCAQSNWVNARGETTLKTPFALRHLPQRKTMKWHVCIAKPGLGERSSCAHFAPSVSAAWLLPKWNPYSRYLAFNSFFLFQV